MEVLGAAPPVPTMEELIAKLGPALTNVIKEEMSDEADSDRIWVLRNIHKSYLYFRNLQYYAPQLFQSLLDYTGVNGPSTTGNDQTAAGVYDYSQNHYRGYCRKFGAVLGNRMPNAIAAPNNPDDESAIKAISSANAAALYAREKCNLELQNLELSYGLFNYGTNFWRNEYVQDGDKYGWEEQPTMEPQQQPLGNPAAVCPQCTKAHDMPDGQQPPACQDCGAPLGPEHVQPPQMATVMAPGQPKKVAKGALEVSLHNGSEVFVPLDSDNIDGSDGKQRCEWLRWEREIPKGKALGKWGDLLRDKSQSDIKELDTSASNYAQAIRSAMASPIGLVRQQRSNRWLIADTWLTPAMYEMIDEKEMREELKTNYPSGLRMTSVRGKIVEMKDEALADVWLECKLEPSSRIMCDPLGNDWFETQDILTNTLNQCNETIERANAPTYYDPTRVDGDALQNRASIPAEYIPALRPAGGRLSDIVFHDVAPTFSEQIPQFRSGVEEAAKNNTGLLDPIWGGGDAEEPTARQAELKKNAALMQLGVMWTQMRKCYEKLYLKICHTLSQYEEGVLAFSKKNQFGKFQAMAVVIEDLRNDNYHFEADEAIPLTWGQQRDLIMWMLDKPAPLLEMWGMTDPMNIFEFKQTLGMPGMRIPGFDSREKGMDVIAQLLQAKPLPPQPDPPDPTTGQPAMGPPQPSIAPAWEEDHAFMANLAKAYLNANKELQQANPDGYANVVMWGQAQEKIANQPPPPPPVKGSVAVALKGEDLGDPAVQDSLAKSGIISPNTQVQTFAEKQAAFVQQEQTKQQLKLNGAPPAAIQ